MGVGAMRYCDYEICQEHAAWRRETKESNRWGTICEAFCEKHKAMVEDNGKNWIRLGEEKKP